MDRFTEDVKTASDFKQKCPSLVPTNQVTSIRITQEGKIIISEKFHFLDNTIMIFVTCVILMVMGVNCLVGTNEGYSH